ncbi:MAG: Smr/MutS family protein [Bacilli bacterium]|nr:Smr/MutS family protein [Bacilli bacterium]
MITHKTPRLDLHGEERALVYALVVEFINDNYKIGNKEIVIIHGKSTNILTKEVHNVLRDNKLVKKYYLNNWNIGETIVELI